MPRMNTNKILKIFAACSFVVFTAVLLGGCTLLTDTAGIVDNWGTTHVGIVPTNVAYLSDETAYVEFSQTLYKGKIQFAPQHRFGPVGYTPVKDAPVEFVYLTMDKTNFTARTIFDKARRTRWDPSVAFVKMDSQSLPESKTEVPRIVEKYYEGDEGRLIPPDAWYKIPQSIETKHDWLWYVCYPLQFPAGVFDVTVTLGAVIVILPVKLCEGIYNLF